MSADEKWTVGRVGMLYRDLVPDTRGRDFLASLIRIPDGGPVGDYVHFHRVHFQMIYCTQGWVRVVYEDQGEPLVLHPGDCVLQPPEIRHRVLEASPGLEVLEIVRPADHVTKSDTTVELPNSTVNPERVFGEGQRFVRHEAEGAEWIDGRRDLGIPGAYVQHFATAGEFAAPTDAFVFAVNVGDGALVAAGETFTVGESGDLVCVSLSA